MFNVNRTIANMHHYIEYLISVHQIHMLYLINKCDTSIAIAPWFILPTRALRDYEYRHN